MNTTERLEKQEIGHAKKGLLYGVASGASWGLSGVVMSIAFGMAPFTEGVSLLLAPIVGAAMHDGLAGLWVFLYNLLNFPSLIDKTKPL